MTVSTWGIVAYALFYGSVVTGVLLSSSFFRRWPAVLARAGRAHEVLSLGGFFAVAVHVLASVFPPQGIQVSQLAFLGPARRPGLGLGVASLYAIVLVTVTFYLRHRVGTPLWRWIHALAYPALAAAAWHSVTIGANAWLPGAQAFYLLTVGSTGLLLCARLLNRLAQRRVRLCPRTPG
jgi:DMSO/TMAO reductase YedYZ heme-binding membrane subunit